MSVDVLQADLTELFELVKVETLLRDDDSIGILVNNASATLPAPSGTRPPTRPRS